MTQNRSNIVFLFKLKAFSLDLTTYVLFSVKISEFLGMDARPYTFQYAELRAATNDFNPANKLGEGGFGPVFKVNISNA